ncbi:MAG TPA: SDR family oxidoreductase [Candidatus Nanoarchaeia archaeon]|nr:SDR family oxidoreductase [Candidatus Nanoarchaeia archaeon]
MFNLPHLTIQQRWLVVGEEFGIADRNVVITGAASGIGRAMAQRFVEYGSIVHILDSNETEAERTAQFLEGGSHRPQYAACDVTDASSYARILNQIDRECGGIDVMIHNAGIPQKPLKIHEVDAETAKKIVGVNSMGVLYGTQIVTPLMIGHGGGVQLYTSSTASTIGMEDRAIYDATKHFVDGLIQSCAIDYAPDNVRFVGIAPGRVRTPFVNKMLKDRPELREVLENTAGVWGRMMEPEEIADVAVFAASKMARAITGVTIGVGGFENGMNLSGLYRKGVERGRQMGPHT